MANEPTWLTAEYLQRIVQNVFNDQELKIKEFDVSSGSNAGDGYMSQIFRIKIDSPKQLSIIAKVLSIKSSSGFIEERNSIYDKEKLMLQAILPKLLTKLPNPVRFFPQCIHADDAHRALFLEDLCEDGYQLCEHSSGVDLPHSLLVMEALAKLHATSYLVFKENPDLIKQFEKCFYAEESRPFHEKLIMNTHKGLLEIMDKLNLAEEYKRKLQNADDWTSRMIDTWKRKENSFNVLIQTDCWVNNLMFKYNEGGVQAVKLIDFQLGTYNSFALDLISFIFSNTSTYVKTSCVDTLLNHYYTVFTGITGNIQNFTKDILWKEFNERLFVAFLAMVSGTPWVMAPPKENAIDLDALMNNDNIVPENTKIYKNPKFWECIEKTMPYFVKK